MDVPKANENENKANTRTFTAVDNQNSGKDEAVDFQDEKSRPIKRKLFSISSFSKSSGGDLRKRIRSILRSNPAIDTEPEATTKSKLHQAIKDMDTEKRFQKALWHFKDSLYLRHPRHDLDHASNFVRFVYQLQTHPNTQIFLLLISWGFMLLSFIEPSYQNDPTYNTDGGMASYITVLLGCEIAAVSTFWIDWVFHIIHYSKNTEKKWFDRYIRTWRIPIGLILNLLFTIDLIIFHTEYPNLTFRFSRFFRPFLLVIYSHTTASTVVSILQSAKNLIDLLLFFLIIAIVYGFIGTKVIGDLDGEAAEDPYFSNFNNLGKAINIMFILLSGEGWPDVMLPAYEVSDWYLLYFVPFAAFSRFLLIPIPVAVLFEIFRLQRSKKVIIDTLREKEALFACFICLDTKHKRVLYQEDFTKLLENLFRNYKEKDKIENLYKLLDEDGNGFVELDEFYQVPELLYSNKEFTSLGRIKNPCWDFVRDKINLVFRFDKLVKKKYFDVTMLIVVFANSIIIIIYTATSSQNLKDSLDNIDNDLVWIYLAEAVIKIIGLGIGPYWDDNWNKVDFIVTSISVITNIAFSAGNVSQTLSSNKTLRIVRLNRTISAVKFLRAFRALKTVKFLAAGADSFTRVKNFIFKILIVLPTVVKLVSIIFMVTYFYAIIAMEQFNSNQAEEQESQYFDQYVNWDTFGGSLMCLFQIILLQKWTDIMYDIAARFNISFWGVSFYFNSYFVIAILVIGSLIQGMIWDIFTIVDRNLEDQDRLAQLVEAAENVKKEEDGENKKTKSKLNPLKDTFATMKHSKHRKTFTQVPNPKESNSKDLESSQIPVHRERNKNFLSFQGFFGWENQNDKASVYELTENNPNDCQNDKEKGKTSKFSMGKFGLFSKKSTASTGKKDPLSKVQVKNPQKSTREVNKSKFQSIINTEENPTEPDSKLPLVSTDQDINKKESQLRIKQNTTHSKYFPSEESKELLEKKEDARDSSKKVHFLNSDIPSEKAQDFGSKFLQTLNVTSELTQLNEVILTEEPEILDIVEMEEFKHDLKVALQHLMDSKSKIAAAYRKHPKFRASLVLTNQIGFGGIVKERINFGKVAKEEDEKFIQAEKEFYKSRIFILNEKKVTVIHNVHRYFSKIRDSIPSFTKPRKNTLSQKAKVQQPASQEGKTEPKKEPWFPSITEFRPVLLETLEKEREDDPNHHVKEKRMQMQKSNENQEIIMRKALLKDTKGEIISKIEERHFRAIYGDWYNAFKRQTPTSMIGLYDIENRLIVQFTRILRATQVSPENFARTLLAIEENLNGKLLKKGGLGKFMFQNRKQKWFVLSRKIGSEKIGIINVKNGPWNYYEELFNESNKIHEARNVLTTTSSAKEYSQRFHESLSLMAKGFLKCCSFNSFSIEKSVWNMFAIPFRQTDHKQRVIDLMRKHKDDPSINMLDVIKYSIKRCLFVSINLESTKASKKEKNPKQEDAKKLTRIQTKGLEQGEVHTEVTELVDEELEEGVKQAEKEDPYSQDFLPTLEYMEFLNDIADNMDSYSSNFFDKMSSFCVINRTQHRNEKKFNDF